MAQQGRDAKKMELLEFLSDVCGVDDEEGPKICAAFKDPRYTLSLSLSLSHTHSLSHTQRHTLAHTLSLSLSLTHTLTHALSHTHSPSPSLAGAAALTHPRY